jgi:hypothetical protein
MSRPDLTRVDFIVVEVLSLYPDCFSGLDRRTEPAVVSRKFIKP